MHPLANPLARSTLARRGINSCGCPPPPPPRSASRPRVPPARGPSPPPPPVAAAHAARLAQRVKRMEADPSSKLRMERPGRLGMRRGVGAPRSQATRFLGTYACVPHRNNVPESAAGPHTGVVVASHILRREWQRLVAFMRTAALRGFRICGARRTTSTELWSETANIARKRVAGCAIAIGKKKEWGERGERTCAHMVSQD